jgi:hypothetical protein
MKGSAEADASDSGPGKKFVIMKVFYINMSYLKVTTGFLRFILIVNTNLIIANSKLTFLLFVSMNKCMLFASWVAAASVPKNSDMFESATELKSTRSGHLFFTVVGWLVAWTIFFYNLIDINASFLAKLKKVPWSIVVSQLIF